MLKPVFFVVILSVFSICNAQYSGFTKLKENDKFKTAFAAASRSTASIQADFTQEKSLSMLSEKIISKGKFWYKKENNLRMEYLQPYTYLMILHAGRIYVKDGQKENTFSANSNKTFQQVNRILIDCVAGTMMDNPDFQTDLFESGTSFLIELKPVTKNLKELYKNINIVIDKKDYTAALIEMFEVSGDKTIMRFQNKIINAPIPDTLFFIP
jgi:outer membrane lipoprotein-sorting protein